jgi:hypothetical protein
MTLTLELTPDEEERLREKAARQGQDASAYALGLLRQGIQAVPSKESGKTLAETLAGRVGLFEHEGPGYRAQEGGAAFAEHLAQKRQDGQL